jgi:hypothetical protein
MCGRYTNTARDPRVIAQPFEIRMSPAVAERALGRATANAHDVMSQQAVIVSMVGSTTSKKTTDPSQILNAVCNEGWELINGSFVFVEQGQQSRDKFMSSGQNVAIKGTTVGYYLFRRCPENRKS